MVISNHLAFLSFQGNNVSNFTEKLTVLKNLNEPKLNTGRSPPERTQIDLLARGPLSCLVLRVGVSQYIAVHNTVQPATIR